MQDSKFEFNFWPAFTDLMLSLVLIVLIILFTISRMLSAGNVDLDKAEEYQNAIVNQIKNDLYGKYVISTNVEDKADIYVFGELDRQTFTFSDKILFDSDQRELKSSGHEVLAAVSQTIVKNLDNIREIQIQGHADTDFNSDYNLRLASERAISVFNYLTLTAGIEPERHLISITSFGPYKPVSRKSFMKFSKEELAAANADENLKAKNRRIEIVVFYNNGQGSN